MKKGIQIILILLSIGCSTTLPVESNYIGADFDLQDGTIYLTEFKDGVGSIISYEIKNNKIDSITNPKTGYDLRPRISSNKKSIIYISFPLPGEEHPHLILKNLESNRTDTLLKSQPFLTEAIFSHDEMEVLFFCASEYKNYSPIVRPMNHGFDLFAVSLKTKKIRRISDKKEYVMQLLNLTEDGQHISCAMPPMDGIVKMSISTGKKIPVRFNGSPRQEVVGLFKAISLGKDSALYEAPYEIYSHDLAKHKSKFILRTPDNSHFQIIRPDSTWNNLFFTTSSNGLYVYNRRTKQLADLKERIIK